MDKTILLIHSVVAVLFILSVLVQDKGTGMGSAIGGVSGGFHASKRGAAKVLHYASVVFGTFFLLSALVYAVVPQSPLPIPSTPTVTESVSDASDISPEGITVETVDGSGLQVDPVPAE